MPKDDPTEREHRFLLDTDVDDEEPAEPFGSDPELVDIEDEDVFEDPEDEDEDLDEGDGEEFPGLYDELDD